MVGPRTGSCDDRHLSTPGGMVSVASKCASAEAWRSDQPASSGPPPLAGPLTLEDRTGPGSQTPSTRPQPCPATQPLIISSTRLLLLDLSLPRSISFDCIPLRMLSKSRRTSLSTVTEIAVFFAILCSIIL